MRKLKLILILVLLPCLSFHAQVLCNGAGNVLVYSNYDGGQLTINVDQNIPNLKIGICTYEDCSVIITGPFAGNVTAVRYAGFQGDNDHCGLGLSATTVTGVSAAIVTILFAPPASIADPNGNGNIICAYSCDASNQGGCNTSTQIASYFTNAFGGTLRSYFTQYGCWPAEAQLVSNGGNCCPGTANAPIAVFTASDSSICPGDCITFTNQSTGNPTGNVWSFPGGVPNSSSSPNPGTVCYPSGGSFTASLTVSNANGSTSSQQVIAVGPCEVPGCLYQAAVNFNPLATIDNGSCAFPDCQSNCPADLDGNGLVGVADLLQFVVAFGTICP